MKSKLKLYTQVLLGIEYAPRVDVRLNRCWVGSEYGGFFVALDRLSSETIVYSVGIGEDISFDLELIDLYGLKVFGFDPTPQSLEWIASQKLPGNFKMHPYGLADFNGTAKFYAPKNSEHVSHSLVINEGSNHPCIEVEMRTLEGLQSLVGESAIDILKIDIEGAEYKTIDHLLMSDCRPAQLLVEFHHRSNNFSVADTRNAVRKIRDAGYLLFGLSASGHELSFICKEAIK